MEPGEILLLFLVSKCRELNSNCFLKYLYHVPCIHYLWPINVLSIADGLAGASCLIGPGM
jgi:hypothetical protein